MKHIKKGFLIGDEWVCQIAFGVDLLYYKKHVKEIRAYNIGKANVEEL